MKRKTNQQLAQEVIAHVKCNFRIGDRVTLNSRTNVLDRSNTGTVRNVYPPHVSLSIDVQWDNGSGSVYTSDELRHLAVFEHY